MRRKVIYPVMMASAVGLSVAWADDTAQEKKKEEVKVTKVIVNDDKPIQVRGRQILLTDESKDGDDKKVIVVRSGEPIEVTGEKIVVGKLWLGVGLKSIEGDLSEFLDTDKGVLIEEVQEGSPAAKAKIKKGDIVLAVDAKELEGPGDLLEVMKSAKADVALTLKIRRKNEEMEVKVTPEPRPNEVTMGIDLSNLQKEIGDANFTFEMLDPQKLEVFRMGQPAGVIAHAGSGMKGDLKLHIVNKQDGKSLEVKIDREGEKPATITVTKDGETKTYTEEQIGELPEDIRGMVSPMLQSGGPAVFSFTPGNLDQLKSLDSLKKGFKLNLEAHHDQAMEHAQKALQHALEQVASGADHAKAAADAMNSPEFRKQMDEIRAKVSAQVSEAAGKAAEEARLMKEKAKQTVADAKQQTKSSANSAEVEELRAMVQQLKKEIAELKSASKDK